MKRIYLTFIQIFVLIIGFSQVQDFGTPLTFKDKVEKTDQFFVTPKFDLSGQLALDEQNRISTNNKMHRFGKEFEVSIDLFENSKKTRLPNGDFLYQFGIYSPNAITINTIFDQFKLASGVYVYISDFNKKDFDGAYTDLNNNNANVLGTDVVYSDKVIIEVYVPKEKDGQSQLNLGTIIHGYKDVNEMMKSLNSSGSCEIDVNCPLGAGWENQRNSVAMMMNGGGFCTGSLINNTSGTIIPYFLSANHCGTNPTSWVFRFRWESPAGQVDCATSAPSVDGPTTMTVNGGTLKASSANSDFTLTQLNSAPDPQWSIYYNGWDRSGIAPTQCTGIHHPAGDIKKISRDDDPAIESSWTGTPANSHWRVQSWDQGVTEGGSSGSPLFDQNHRVVGQLHGGASGCGNDSANLWDDYGKIAMSWDGEGTDNTRLSNWLDPSDLGSLYIDGSDPLVPTSQLDAGINAPTGVNGTICGNTTILPKITISNSGSTNLTSATINYGFDGVNTLNYTWNGNLSFYQTTVVNLPSIVLSSGNHTFWASVVNPNGSIDQNSNNDQINSSFTIVTNGEIDTLNLNLDQYGSEVQWTIEDNNNTVLYSGGPYSDLSSCATFLVKKGVCLTYGCYTFTITDAYGDGLSTTGCEGSYTFTRSDSTIIFELDTADANYGSSKITNFCVQDDLSLNELSENGIKIYPNPASSDVTISTSTLQCISIEIYSLIGQKVFQMNVNSNENTISLKDFTKGAYTVKVNTSKGPIVKNIIVL